MTINLITELGFSMIEIVVNFENCFIHISCHRNCNFTKRFLCYTLNLYNVFVLVFNILDY